MNTNNSFRIKNSRNEQATIWPIGNNTYFCSIKWDDRDSTMTVSKNAVDSLVECGEWNIVQEDKLSNLPDTFKFVTDVCEDHDGNVYTCTILKDFSHPRITWIDEDGNRQISGSYCKDTIQKYIENGTWKIVEEEDEQEPDLMNYLYEIIRSGGSVSDEEEQSAQDSSDILRLISDFTASSNHYFVIEKGQMNIYHADNSIPYTCENGDDIVTVMGAIETLDGYSKG